MTATSSAAPSTTWVEGAAPAGLNEAQILAFKRLQTARTERAALAPLGPDHLFAERYFERWKDES